MNENLKPIGPGVILAPRMENDIESLVSRCIAALERNNSLDSQVIVAAWHRQSFNKVKLSDPYAVSVVAQLFGDAGWSVNVIRHRTLLHQKGRQYLVFDLSVPKGLVANRISDRAMELEPAADSLLEVEK